MKAITVHQFGGPEVMKLDDVSDLKAAAQQVIVQTKAIGVNPVDVYIRSGSYPLKPPLPYTPGMDAAGVVAEVGAKVTRVRQGERVYVAGTISGAYAEFTLCDQSQVHHLPDQISFEQGAAVGVPYGTAYRALFHRAQAKPGETVLVHGASGGVGVASIQLARAAEMVVIGTGGTEKGRRLILEQGAHHTLDHKSPGYLNDVMPLTENRGVDIVLEMLANVNLDKDLNVLAKNGRVVVIGSRGTVEIDPRAAMMRDASILGMALMNATRDDLKVIHAALVAGLENGNLKPVISQKFPLAEAARAHQAIMEPGAFGKIVLLP